MFRIKSVSVLKEKRELRLDCQRFIHLKEEEDFSRRRRTRLRRGKRRRLRRRRRNYFKEDILFGGWLSVSTRVIIIWPVLF